MSIIIPIGTDRPQRRFPWMNILLIAANVVIFLAGLALAPRASGPYAAQLSMPPAWMQYMLNGPGGLKLYQFITYQFLHQGWQHIGFNMLFLYVFGNNLNEKMGHIGYLAFYLAGGVLAGCGQVLAQPGTPTLGASGAISAVTGLFLVLLPNIHIRLFVWIFIYIDKDLEVPSMYFILLKIGQDVYEQFSGGAGVAYMAHLAGTAAGIAIGLFLLGSKLVQRDHYDLLAMLNRYRRRKVYQSMVAGGYEPFNPNPARGSITVKPSKREIVPEVDPRIASLRAEISRLLRLHEISDAAQRFLELRAIDPTQVLPPQEQVDVANQLMAEGRHKEAAAAYEDYLRVYPTGGAGQQEQLTLMLGLIYARYDANLPRAKELLSGLLPRLHDAKQREFVEGELKWLASQG
jgi:membrane associated rhomboid family serine protease